MPWLSVMSGMSAPGTKMTTPMAAFCQDVDFTASLATTRRMNSKLLPSAARFDSSRVMAHSASGPRMISPGIHADDHVVLGMAQEAGERARLGAHGHDGRGNGMFAQHAQRRDHVRAAADQHDDRVRLRPDLHGVAGLDGRDVHHRVRGLRVELLLGGVDERVGCVDLHEHGEADRLLAVLLEALALVVQCTDVHRQLQRHWQDSPFV